MIYRGHNNGEGFIVYHDGVNKASHTSRSLLSLLTTREIVKTGRLYDEPGGAYYGSTCVDELMFFNHQLLESKINFIINMAWNWILKLSQKLFTFYIWGGELSKFSKPKLIILYFTSISKCLVNWSKLTCVFRISFYIPFRVKVRASVLWLLYFTNVGSEKQKQSVWYSLSLLSSVIKLTCMTNIPPYQITKFIFQIFLTNDFGVFEMETNNLSGNIWIFMLDWNQLNKWVDSVQW